MWSKPGITKVASSACHPGRSVGELRSGRVVPGCLGALIERRLRQHESGAFMINILRLLLYYIGFISLLLTASYELLKNAVYRVEMFQVSLISV